MEEQLLGGRLKVPSLISRATSHEQKVLIQAQALLMGIKKAPAPRRKHSSPSRSELLSPPTGKRGSTRRVKFEDSSLTPTSFIHPAHHHHNHTPSEVTPDTAATPLSWDDIFKLPASRKVDKISPKALFHSPTTATAATERRGSITPQQRKRLAWTKERSPASELKLPDFKPKLAAAGKLDRQYSSNREARELRRGSGRTEKSQKIHIVVDHPLQTEGPPIRSGGYFASRNPEFHQPAHSTMQQQQKQELSYESTSTLLKSASGTQFRKQRVPSYFKMIAAEREPSEDRNFQRGSTKRAQASAKEQLFREFQQEFQQQRPAPPKKKKKRAEEPRRVVVRRNLLKQRTPNEQAYIKGLIKQPKLPAISMRQIRRLMGQRGGQGDDSQSPRTQGLSHQLTLIQENCCGLMEESNDLSIDFQVAQHTQRKGMENVSQILQGLEHFEASDSSYSGEEESNFSFEPRRYFKDKQEAERGLLEKNMLRKSMAVSSSVTSGGEPTAAGE